MQHLISLYRVLHAGESLADPATWKNFQLLVNAALGVIGVIAGMHPEWALSEGDINALAIGCGIVGFVANGYLTMATTEKIGFKRKCWRA